MKNLESKDLPFRTLDEFYQPKIKLKTGEGIRVFPKNEQGNRQGFFSNNQELPSIINYISGLNEAKNLPRRIHNRHQYFSIAKPCKCHKEITSIRGLEIPQEDVVRQKQNQKSRFETLVSNNNTSFSTAYILNHKKAYERQLNEQKGNFNSQKTFTKQEKNKEMRFSFYNTIEKSDYFIKKFKEDSFLSERKTNKFQNMFRRNITANQILNLLDKSKEKLKKGY